MSAKPAQFGRAGAMGTLVAIVGLGLFAVGYFGASTAEAKRTVMESYVFAYTFWAGMTIGCLGLTLLHHTVRAKWSLSILRLIEAGGGPASILALAVMFIPIALNVAGQNDATVYLWARPESAHDHLLHNKAFFLNVPFFLGRQVFYFLILFLFAFALRRSSLAQDKSMDASESAFRTNLSAPGIVVFFVIMTGAVTDWVMSLEPHWFSTILTILYVVGSALSALALCVILMMVNRNSEPYKSIINPGLTKDLGNMLFAITLLWTYMTVSQFIITWYGNLPEEIPYYVRRSEPTGWHVLGALIIGLQWFVPFMVLLAPRTKAYAKNLMAIAVVIFAMRFVDVYWTVMPGLRDTALGSLSQWTDYAALVALGGVWFMIWGSQVTKGSLIPIHDGRLEESNAHA